MVARQPLIWILHGLITSGPYQASGQLVGHSGDSIDAQVRPATAATYMQQYSLHEQYSAESFSLTIEGDTSVLADYFGSEPTAQRIFDHVSGLVAGMTPEEPVFQQAMADIMAGVEAGFEQAEAMLQATLPEVSRDTATILEAMLAELRETGSRQLLAADFLHLVAAEEEK